jgi:hypothetical protein
LAIKGLSKINPKLGAFVQKAMDSGYDFSEIKDFIGEKIGQSQAKTTGNENIVEKYDPNLHAFVKEEIGKGTNLDEIRRKSITDPKFKKSIDKLVKDHKISWGSILNTIYANEKEKADC